VVGVVGAGSACPGLHHRPPLTIIRAQSAQLMQGLLSANRIRTICDYKV